MTRRLGVSHWTPPSTRNAWPPPAASLSRSGERRRQPRRPKVPAGEKGLNGHRGGCGGCRGGQSAGATVCGGHGSGRRQPHDQRLPGAKLSRLRRHRSRVTGAAAGCPSVCAGQVRGQGRGQVGGEGRGRAGGQAQGMGGDRHRGQGGDRQGDGEGTDGGWGGDRQGDKR